MSEFQIFLNGGIDTKGLHRGASANRCEIIIPHGEHQGGLTLSLTVGETTLA
jgi:hypothetical protein